MVSILRVRYRETVGDEDEMASLAELRDDYQSLAVKADEND